MPTCKCCDHKFTPIRFNDPGASRLIMALWYMRQDYCWVCLFTFQTEWVNSEWAANLGIPTI